MTSAAGQMSEMEMTKLCAEAMGYEVERGLPWDRDALYCWPPNKLLHTSQYDPLHDDEQAMALVKKLRLALSWVVDEWVCVDNMGNGPARSSKDLNRAICLCVAELQKRGTDHGR